MFFLKIFLAIQHLLCFHANFKIICSNSMKNVILWGLYWIYRMSCVYGHVNIIISPSPWAQNIFPFVWSFAVFFITVLRFSHFKKQPMDCSLPGSSVHGIFQARILEWIAISFSRGSSQSRDWTQVSHVADRLFTVWTIRETPLENPMDRGAWQATVHRVARIRQNATKPPPPIANED